MCGRYTLRAGADNLAQVFDVPIGVRVQPRYNIAPSQPVLAVRATQDPRKSREMTFLCWGLIPFWAKDPKIGWRLINARAETVAEKPSFRAAFKYRRCLIPADGFYEWQRQGKRKKQPYHIRGAQNQEVFAFAGLWEHWQGPNGEELETCTIITTEPNDLMQPIHDRMPVIVAPQDYDRWLTADVPRQVQSLLKPYPAELLEAVPVKTTVNNPSIDSPECLTIDDKPSQVGS